MKKQQRYDLLQEVGFIHKLEGKIVAQTCGIIQSLKELLMISATATLTMGEDLFLKQKIN